MPEVELIPPEEQIIRKKAEEKILVPPKPSRLPIMLPDRDRRAGIPVIPTDPCCAKICKTLNDTIENKRKLLGDVVTLGGGRGLYKSRTYRSLIYGIESLEDHRQKLKDEENCRCTEETGAVSIILPLINELSKPEEKLPSAIVGPRLVSPPPERVRRIHIGEKHTIPKTNSCCPTSCNILNDDINRMGKILDNMELRGGPKVYKNPRYEALSFKEFYLQEYRSALKKKESCKCIE